MKHGRLAGKVAIVTGAAPQATGVGNGSAVGVLFAREGAKVVLVNRSESRCPRTAAHDLGGRGRELSVCGGCDQSR